MKYLLILFLLLPILACDAGSSRPLRPPPVQMEQVEFSSIIDGEQYYWQGRLYSRGAPNPTRRLQLLLGGISYDTGLYWDAPFTGFGDVESYNYADWAAQKGHDILVIDLRPDLVRDGDLITLRHQRQRIWVTLLGMAAKGYSPLNTHCIGHSAGAMEMADFMGSGMQPICASLVSVGWSATPHALPSYVTPDLVNSLLENKEVKYPAAFREKAFYKVGAALPNIIEADNALATGSPRGRVLSAIGALMTVDWTAAKFVQAPVLLIGGDSDELYPFATITQDFYGVYTQVLAPKSLMPQSNSGHSLNFHRGHTDTWQAMYEWVESH